MKCKKCKSKEVIKDGKRPLVIKNKIRRFQAYKCKKCNHQWVDR